MNKYRRKITFTINNKIYLTLNRLQQKKPNYKLLN